MFQFLETTLEKLEEERQTEAYNKLMDHLLTRLAELVRINSEKSQSIISKFSKSSELFFNANGFFNMYMAAP